MSGTKLGLVTLDCPTPDLLVPNGYVVGEDIKLQRGKRRIDVSFAPVIISGRFYVRHQEFLRVSWDWNLANWRHLVLPAKWLTRPNKLVKLADYGLPTCEELAPRLVHWFYAFYSVNYEALPVLGGPAADDDLEEISARAEAATDGPWRWTHDHHNGNLQRAEAGKRWAFNLQGRNLYPGLEPSPFHSAVMQLRCGGLAELDPELILPSPEDAEFIAHSRADVPRLIEEIRILREIIQNLGDL